MAWADLIVNKNMNNILINTISHQYLKNLDRTMLNAIHLKKNVYVYIYKYKMTSEAQKAANKRYRAKNYAKCIAINARSNRKTYSEDKKPQLTRSKAYYHKNRNYRDISNMGNILNNLFNE